MTEDSHDRLSRRSLIQRASVFGTSLALGLPATGSEASTTSPEASRLKIIVTGGHPGDPEYGCGGTIARYADLGSDVVLLYLNKGLTPEAAKAGGAPDRVGEAAKACEILKARPLYAGQIDGDAIVDRERYEQFRTVLEAERPDVVFTHWPIDNHADHRAISMLVYDAWLRMKKAFALYYYEVSNGSDTVQFTPTQYVDSARLPIGSERPATRTRARRRIGSTSCRRPSRGCEASNAGLHRPRDSSGTCRARTSCCR